MTWRSTAVASAVMVVGTWLASYAPVGGPRPQPSASPSAARTETAAAEIQREASRLHDRLNQVTSYRLPARNPFLFGAPPQAPPAPPPEPAFTVEDVAPVNGAPTLRLMLSGIAEDIVDDQMVRTAIISTPENVYLVKVGETISDTYKVTRIEATVVELVRLDDGSTVQLTLRP